ncbi:MAG: NAD(P)-binding domain-containing protein [Bacteroidota bacterium]|nr:NAD(P)-binding domain-containing protein [Bacteroidota bacterium]
MKFGILGSGSWGTALAKILTDNHHSINWWIRTPSQAEYILRRRHNPQYLSTAYFDPGLLRLSGEVAQVIKDSDHLIIAVPSAYVAATLGGLPKDIFSGKKVISAVKGMLPDHNLLLNQYLEREFSFDLAGYFTILGPCHAEEVAAEKLSYLTFSGIEDSTTRTIAAQFQNDYIKTIINPDIFGVQYAAVLKNIYALGAGIAHGLEYGDNFLSVLIANSADEMAGFLRKTGIQNLQVGSIEHQSHTAKKEVLPTTNYAASVYLGDLLVTCYSLYSRNRTFGNMIGKGYSVRAAQIEMNMVAEGYNASRCIYNLNKDTGAEMPIAATIYKILWEHLAAEEGFREIEQTLV